MTPAEVLASVAERTGVPVETLRGKQRTRYVCRARAEAMHLLRGLGMSMSEIGAMLGGRDHATVIYGLFRHAVARAECEQQACAREGA